MKCYNLKVKKVTASLKCNVFVDLFFLVQFIPVKKISTLLVLSIF